MITLSRPNHVLAVASASAALALAAMTVAGTARASGVPLAVSIGVPGILVYPNNAYPVYTQAPVYVQPRPVYYRQVPVYYSSQPVYYEHPHGWKHGHHKKHHKHNRHDSNDDRFERHDGYKRGYHSPGYAPIYYQR